MASVGADLSPKETELTTKSSLEGNKIEDVGSGQDEIQARSFEYPQQLSKFSLLDSMGIQRAGPSNQKKGSLKQTLKRDTGLKMRPTDAGSGESASKETGKAGDPSIRQISSATLKKLLTQARLGTSNSGSNSSNSSNDVAKRLGLAKSSNFKFVFIQKATAAPMSNSSQQVDRSNKSESKKPNSKPSASSLAASVSKQLASSLLYTAANLVGNITNSQASISSLASQITSQPQQSSSTLDERLASQRNHTHGKMKDKQPNYNGTSAELTKNLLLKNGGDIERASATGKATKAKQQGETNTSRKVKKNSKIYNLPVKFVSNGQPSQVLVLNTLKQHFAAIKRLQSAASNLSGLASAASGSLTRNRIATNNNNQTNDNHSGSTKGRKKYHNDNNSFSNMKIKGVNSRLIYLPLQFLTNGMPSRLTLSRGTSKHSKRF